MADNFLKETSAHIAKGTVIYHQSNVVKSISILVKGKVLIQNEKLCSVVPAGSFLGVYDLYRGSYQSSYSAIEDSMIISISIDSADDLVKIGEKHPGYGGLLVTYFCKRIKQLFSIYQRIKYETITLGQSITELYQSYRESCIANNIEPEKLDDINQISTSGVFSLPYMKEIDYYVDCLSVEPEILKKYYNASKHIYMYHIDNQQLIIDNLLNDLEYIVDEYNVRVSAYIADRSCLYTMIARLAGEYTKLGIDNSVWMDTLIAIREKLDSIEELYRSFIADVPDFDRARIDKIYSGLLETSDTKYNDNAISMLEDSYHTIMDYAGVDKNTRESFLGLLDEYDKLQDKAAVDKNLVRIRDGINNYFYKIYADVFFKAKEDYEQPLCVRLFLKYGFINEKYLNEEQLTDLISLDEEMDNGDMCHVYTLYEWLMLISTGEKEPSKSEFDLDYDEYIREQLKQKAITDTEANILSRNNDRKVQYEIDNVFTYVNKLLSTKATIFVPVLHKDVCANNLYSLRMTPYRLNSAVKKVLDIDFSVFSREVMYTNPEAGINKDYVVKEVFPDVILFPCYGVRAIMWQDISGKKRDSEGRFVFPALFEGDEYVTVVGLLGRFRWELCKTIQGIKWNDVRVNSLTSEYQDYIQFYRKNSGLSDEWKEKVNRQIKNSRNNTKEIFTRDYIEWIIRESSGNMRISKVSREILATYCPFVKSIRDNLDRIPVYAAAMKRYTMSSSKKIKEYEARCLHLERAGKEVPKEIKQTRDYYKM